MKKITTNSRNATKLSDWDIFLKKFETLNQTEHDKLGVILPIKELLGEFCAKQEEWKDEQKRRADDFNILRIMRLTRKELCHSDILAWLLDPDGSHAQRNLGFRIFLEYLNLPEEFARTNYRVIREWCGEGSRIDIVVEAESKFIIGIENKIDSEEGDHQTHREWKDLQIRKKTLGICDEVLAFFLTPDGTKPSCESFKPISWLSLANVFERFAEEAKAEMVKVFAKHYTETLRHEF